MAWKTRPSRKYRVISSTRRVCCWPYKQLWCCWGSHKLKNQSKPSYRNQASCSHWSNMTIRVSQMRSKNNSKNSTHMKISCQEQLKQPHYHASVFVYGLSPSTSSRTFGVSSSRCKKTQNAWSKNCKKPKKFLQKKSVSLQSSWLRLSSSKSNSTRHKRHCNNSRKKKNSCPTNSNVQTVSLPHYRVREPDG